MKTKLIIGALILFSALYFQDETLCRIGIVNREDGLHCINRRGRFDIDLTQGWHEGYNAAVEEFYIRDCGGIDIDSVCESRTSQARKGL
jgi:hypothetical protein